MNDLNAQQVVLIALLVAFVTSIATGITVVSLLDQSPEPVTQTINRVVEKTVEKIVEEPIIGDKPVERIVETVVVNAEDLTVDAVAKNSSSLARIYTFQAGARTFLGLGIVVSSDGKILSDVGTNINSAGSKVAVIGGNEFAIEIERTGKGFALFKISQTTENNFSVAKLADSSNVKLAQSVILLSGREQNTVSTGVITDLGTGTLEGGQKFVSELISSVDNSKILTGSILLNLNGEIIGMRADGSLTTQSSFTPSNTVKEFLNAQ